MHARGSVSSYLEPTTKHLIIVTAVAVINAFCPAGVTTTAAHAAHWLTARVCRQAAQDALSISCGAGAEAAPPRSKVRLLHDARLAW